MEWGAHTRLLCREAGHQAHQATPSCFVLGLSPAPASPDSASSLLRLLRISRALRGVYSVPFEGRVFKGLRDAFKAGRQAVDGLLMSIQRCSVRKLAERCPPGNQRCIRLSALFSSFLLLLHTLAQLPDFCVPFTRFNTMDGWPGRYHQDGSANYRWAVHEYLALVCSTMSLTLVHLIREV